MMAKARGQKVGDRGLEWIRLMDMGWKRKITDWEASEERSLRKKQLVVSKKVSGWGQKYIYHKTVSNPFLRAELIYPQPSGSRSSGLFWVTVFEKFDLALQKNQLSLVLQQPKALWNTSLFLKPHLVRVQRKKQVLKAVKVHDPNVNWSQGWKQLPLSTGLTGFPMQRLKLDGNANKVWDVFWCWSKV